MKFLVRLKHLFPKHDFQKEDMINLVFRLFLPSSLLPQLRLSLAMLAILMLAMAMEDLAMLAMLALVMATLVLVMWVTLMLLSPLDPALDWTPSPRGLTL